MRQVSYEGLKSKSLLKLNFTESLKEASLGGFPCFESTKNTYLLDDEDSPAAVILYRELEDKLHEIDFLAVKKEHRGKGLARLLTELITGKVWLEVHEKNHDAISFYIALGFKKVGFRKAYYGSFGAHLMEKRP